MNADRLGAKSAISGGKEAGPAVDNSTLQVQSTAANISS